jgi:imidazolonepropionase-like amidohydrolase
MRTAPRRRFPLLGALLAACAALACGEKPSLFSVAPLSPAPAAVVIRGADVLDVEHGTKLPARDVLLQGGRIAAIRDGGLSAPEGALEVDGRGATLLPGLIDAHAHIDANPAPTWKAGLPDPEANLRSYLYSGVTTLFEAAGPADRSASRREQLARGELVGPRVYTCGAILTAAGGHPVAVMNFFVPWWFRWYIVPRVAFQVSDAASVQASVDRLAKEGTDAVKIAVDRIPLDAPRLSREQIAEIAKAARSHGLRVVAHIGSLEDAIDAADEGVSAWMHGVYKERIPDEAIAKLAGYRIPMVPTLEVFDSYARIREGPREATRLERETADAALLESFFPVPESLDTGVMTSWLELARDARKQGVGLDNVRRLHRAGVTILAGSDPQSGVFPGPALHRELRQLVAAGLTPAEAIRAATLDAARFAANTQDPEFGVVAEGRIADLLLVEGDPLADVAALENIRALFQRGVPIERSTHAADTAAR